MGYGVVMPTISYTHLSAEDRETLSMELAHGQSLGGWPEAKRPMKPLLQRN